MGAPSVRLQMKLPGILVLEIFESWPVLVLWEPLVFRTVSCYAVFVMETFHAETVVQKDGKLHLDPVPFSEGQAVHVFVSSSASHTKQPLKGSVLKYDQPLAPVAEGDWEATK